MNTATTHLLPGLLIALVLAPALAPALASPLAAGSAVAAEAEELAVTSGPQSDWIERDGEIRLELNQPASEVEGRLAVMLGQTDVTDLLRAEGKTLTYRSDVLELPAGKNDLVLYRVLPEGAWVEIFRAEVKVRRRGGVEEVSGSTGIDLQGLWLADEGASDPGSAFSSGDEGATGQIALAGSVARRGWTLRGDMNVLAASELDRALRFGELGESADRVDLSSFTVRLERERAFAQLGDVSYGEHRQLVSGFSSRGLSLGVPLGKAASLTAIAVNGSSIVGWDNLTGLDRSEHQVLAGGIGVELLPSRPGGLRFDAEVLDGSLLPLGDFNQGVVNDAEENTGWGGRLAGSTKGQRLRFQLGYARSDFINPGDPLLAQGSDVVAVRGEEREARYASVDVALVQNKQLAEKWAASVNLGLRHERVDPQYRSVGAFVQADLEQNAAELQASLGSINALAGHSRSEDNLDNVESILKTKTRRNHATLTLPLAMVFSSKPRPWLPSLNYGIDRTHQFGANQPVNGGFSASHIPDQLSANHTAGLDWQGAGWQAGYSFNYSDQDNRQPGRELDDFTNASHGARTSFSPHGKLDLGFDWSRDRAASLASSRIDRNERLGLNLLWRATRRLALSGNFSINETEASEVTEGAASASGLRSTSDTEILNLEMSYRFAFREGQDHGGNGQLFVRYSSQDFESLDEFFGGFVLRDSWTLHTGFNLSLR